MVNEPSVFEPLKFYCIDEEYKFDRKFSCFILKQFTVSKLVRLTSLAITDKFCDTVDLQWLEH